jgi:hypothetical protein
LAVLGASLVLLSCGAIVAGEAEEGEHEPVESITIEETLPNRSGEFSFRLTMDYERTDSDKVARLPSMELNLGITDAFDVALEVPLLYTSGESRAYGLGDISTSFKWLVVRGGKHLPALVLGMEAQFPTGSVRRQLGAGEYVLTPSLAGLKTFGPVVVQGSIGWSQVVASRNGEHEQNMVGGISIAAPLIERKLYGFAELSGSKVINRAEWSTTVAPGLKWLWSDETFVAVALPIPVEGVGRGVGILTQFQWGF